MSRKVVIIILLFAFLFSPFVSAHSGRTDSNGGHNCSEKSQAKGLCSSYHYHNGGGSSNSSSSGANNISSDKDCSDFATYDEVVAYWNSKGYSATYDPENLDGWGNGNVDDGIPCEPPSGYDKTKINNSPEQIQFNQDKEERANGESEGYNQGFKDGYLESTKNSTTNSGSDTFKHGYTDGYNKGYEEGKKKIESEKTKASNEGYTLGKKQENIEIPEMYASHPSLKKAFEDGFNKAVNERVEAKKEEYFSLGYNDGKKDKHSPPQDLEEVYVEAYKEGYSKAQQELKDTYFKQGYDAAFTMLEFEEPNLNNDKFGEWYKEGFFSNREVEEIKNAGFSLGKTGEPLNIPEEYKKGQAIFKHYYEVGYKEYEEEQNSQQKTLAGSISVLALCWIGRRFYIARKMVK
ncbi:MAG TPA: YHYH domain-containing protein [Bacillus sp. (in: firmicutes)]|nr:YHYH domain-containing protein [Bacillus sp. (in: firmicutes)]